VIVSGRSIVTAAQFEGLKGLFEVVVVMCDAMLNVKKKKKKG